MGVQTGFQLAIQAGNLFLPAILLGSQMRHLQLAQGAVLIYTHKFFHLLPRPAGPAGENDGVSLGQGLFQKNAIFCPIGCAEGAAQERWGQPQTPRFS